MAVMLSCSFSQFMTIHMWWFHLVQEPAAPAKKVMVATSKNGSAGAVTKKGKSESSSESDSDEDEVSL